MGVREVFCCGRGDFGSCGEKKPDYSLMEEGVYSTFRINTDVSRNPIRVLLFKAPFYKLKGGIFLFTNTSLPIY